MTHTYIYKYTFTYLHVYVYVYVCIYTHIFVSLYICVCIYWFVHVLEQLPMIWKGFLNRPSIACLKLLAIKINNVNIYPMTWPGLSCIKMDPWPLIKWFDGGPLAFKWVLENVSHDLTGNLGIQVGPCKSIPRILHRFSGIVFRTSIHIFIWGSRILWFIVILCFDQAFGY